MIITAYSMGLYSTWFFYHPDRVLFDCGEGLSCFLGNQVYAIDKVFLTHGHVDHIAGLYNLLNIRNLGMGEPDKPLRIYYPAQSYHIRRLKNYLDSVYHDLDYPLSWTEFRTNERLVIKEGKNPRTLQSFRVKHGNRSLSDNCLGYQIMEQRTKLKPQYLSLSKAELLSLKEKEKIENLTYKEEKKILTITGDTFPIEGEIIDGTELLIHEATFLNKEDRYGETHSSLEEVFEILTGVNVKEVILYHISIRYKEKVDGLVEELKKRYNITIPVRIVYPGELFVM